MLSIVYVVLKVESAAVSFLKLFLVGSTISSVLSYGFILRHLVLLEALSNLVNSKVDLFGIVAILLDSLIQLRTVTTTTFLIANMKPP
ncbi:hypothetical protein LIER_05070 [Lithospermum erythrorhizon]|uniref:Uncharacterized protein n=1 Tax=Lithospermum erythrorhizon TaxID=34254 RepID=A0AAV3P0C9_LITER